MPSHQFKKKWGNIKFSPTKKGMKIKNEMIKGEQSGKEK
jgi:hypothetical protein